VNEKDEQGKPWVGDPEGSGSESGWTPRVEGEEGDPTAFDYVFGAAVAAAVVVAIMWAVGLIQF
jgi:hypothetical protein